MVQKYSNEEYQRITYYKNEGRSEQPEWRKRSYSRESTNKRVRVDESDRDYKASRRGSDGHCGERSFFRKTNSSRNKDDCEKGKETSPIKGAIEKFKLETM